MVLIVGGVTLGLVASRVLSLLAVASLAAFLMLLKRKIDLRKIEQQKKEEIHELKLQFFANISHEIRTPLSLILGPLEALMTGERQLEKNRLYRMMHRNVIRISDLLTELADFGRVETGAIRLMVRKGSPEVFLRELCSLFEDLGEQRNIRFSFSTPDVDRGECWFDMRIVEKILLNLVNNAFKYTAAGGSIVVELSSELNRENLAFENRIKVTSRFRGAKYLYFRVRDTGVGISPDSIGELFDRYYRVNSRHLGSGIGLAFVKSLTLLHKGDIYVSSKRHAGTEIVIAIPCDAGDYSEHERWSLADAISEASKFEVVGQGDILETPQEPQAVTGVSARQQAKTKESGSLPQPGLASPVPSKRDQAFLNVLNEVVNRRMADPELGVHMICKEIGMSRTSLYSKMKDVTDQSVNEFVRTVRLSKAVEMLINEDVTITEVMYRVGIQTQSYFTKAFKKEFGKTPSQFMSEQKNAKNVRLNQKKG